MLAMKTNLIFISLLVILPSIISAANDETDLIKYASGDYYTNQLYIYSMAKIEDFSKKNEHGGIDYHWAKDMIPSKILEGLCIINKLYEENKLGGPKDQINWLKENVLRAEPQWVKLKFEKIAADREGQILCCQFMNKKRPCYTGTTMIDPAKWFVLTPVEHNNDGFVLTNKESTDIYKVFDRFASEYNQKQKGDGYDWTQTPMNIDQSQMGIFCDLFVENTKNLLKVDSHRIKVKFTLNEFVQFEKTLETIMCDFKGNVPNVENQSRFFMPFHLKDEKEPRLLWLEFHKQVSALDASVDVSKIESKFYTLKANSPIWIMGIPPYKRFADKEKEEAENCPVDKKKDKSRKSGHGKQQSTEKAGPSCRFNPKPKVTDFSIVPQDEYTTVLKRIVEMARLMTDDQSKTWKNNPSPAILLKQTCAFVSGTSVKQVKEISIVQEKVYLGSRCATEPLSDVLTCKFSDETMEMHIVQTSPSHYNVVESNGNRYSFKNDKETSVYRDVRKFVDRYGGLRPGRPVRWLQNDGSFDILYKWMCAQSKGFSSPWIPVKYTFIEKVNVNLQPRGFFMATDLMKCSFRLTRTTNADDTDDKFLSKFSSSSSSSSSESSDEEGGNKQINLKVKERKYIEESFIGAFSPFEDSLLVEARYFERGFYYSLQNFKIMRMERRQRQFSLSEELQKVKRETLLQEQTNYNEAVNCGEVTPGLIYHEKWNPSLFLDWVHILGSGENALNTNEMCKNVEDAKFSKLVEITLLLEPISPNIDTYAVVCSAVNNDNTIVAELIFSPIASESSFQVGPIIKNHEDPPVQEDDDEDESVYGSPKLRPGYSSSLSMGSEFTSARMNLNSEYGSARTSGDHYNGSKRMDHVGKEVDDMIMQLGKQLEVQEEADTINIDLTEIELKSKYKPYKFIWHDRNIL